MARKKRVSYAMVEEGLHKGCFDGVKVSTYWDPDRQTRGCNPSAYVLTLKAETGLADWKIAKDLAKDSGCEVTAATVRNWRRKGEKGGN